MLWCTEIHICPFFSHLSVRIPPLFNCDKHANSKMKFIYSLIHVFEWARAITLYIPVVTGGYYFSYTDRKLYIDCVAYRLFQMTSHRYVIAHAPRCVESGKTSPVYLLVQPGTQQLTGILEHFANPALGTRVCDVKLKRSIPQTEF